MSEYEEKLAWKAVHADAKKAINTWHKLGTISIDDVLKRMGYTQTRESMYEYSRRYWAGMEGYTLILNTYSLIVGRQDGLDRGVRK